MAWLQNGAACLLVVAGAWGLVPAAADADYYVATDGNDQWSGTLPAPNVQKTDGPFATLERARDAMRELRAQRAQDRPTVVMARGGTHLRSRPFVLKPDDSRTESSPVIYQAYPGEKPQISGGRSRS